MIKSYHNDKIVIKLDPVVEQAELEKVITNKRPAAKILSYKTNVNSTMMIDPHPKEQTSEELQKLAEM